MSLSLCQGLQSCLEPIFFEPNILTHNSTPPIPTPFHSLPLLENSNSDHNQEQESTQNENQNKGWSFLQSLTITPYSNKQENTTEQVYVHPLVKLSSSALSSKSLEMCTESLGSETGSDSSEDIDELVLMLMQKQNNRGLERSKIQNSSKKVERTVNFPPPLTSISGSGGVQVRPHREDGRLVLKAVTVASCNPYLHAERANGRLTLSFMKDNNLDCENELAEDEDEEKLCIESTEENIEHEYADEVEEFCNDDDDFTNSEDDDDDANSDANGGCWGNDMKINGKKYDDFPRPSRCKEAGNGNKGMPSWGTFLVPIS